MTTLDFPINSAIKDLIIKTVADSPMPMDWESIKKVAKDGVVFNIRNSVVLAIPSSLFGGKTLNIWVAAGELPDVIALVDMCFDFARNNGYTGVTYIGRAGWVREYGFENVATLGYKKV